MSTDSIGYGNAENQSLKLQNKIVRGVVRSLVVGSLVGMLLIAFFLS